MRASRRALFTILCIASIARGEEPRLGQSTDASPARAQTWFEEGQAAYARGEFAIAAALFRAVYIATPTPAILYDLAQAERRARQCKAALAHYEEYLRLQDGASPSDVDRKISEVRSCAKEEDERAPSKPAEASQPPPARTTPPHQEAHQGTTWRALAYGSIGGAVVTAAFATAFLIRAEDARRQLERVNSGGAIWSDRYASYQTAFELENGAAIGFFVASGVMAAAGSTILVSRWPDGSSKSGSSYTLGAPGSRLGFTYRVAF